MTPLGASRTAPPRPPSRPDTPPSARSRREQKRWRLLIAVLLFLEYTIRYAMAALARRRHPSAAATRAPRRRRPPAHDDAAAAAVAPERRPSHPSSHTAATTPRASTASSSSSASSSSRSSSRSSASASASASTASLFGLAHPAIGPLDVVPPRRRRAILPAVLHDVAALRRGFMPPGDAAVGAPSPASASPASGPAVPAASALPSLAGSPSAALRRRGPRRDRQAVFEFHDDDDVSDALEDDENDDDDDDNDDDNDSLASDAALAPQDFYAALDATLAARAFRGAVLRTHPLAAASAHARPMTPMAPTASPAATAFAASAASNAATSLPLDVPRPPSARDFPAPFTASASFSSRAASLSSASSSSSTTSVATASTEHENDSASGSDADRTGRAAAAAARRRRRPQAYPAARQPPQGLHGLQAVHAAPYGGKPAAYAAAWPADPRSPAITAFLPRRARSASVPWHAAAAAPP